MKSSRRESVDHEQEFQDLLKPWCSLAKVIAGFSYLALSSERPTWRTDWGVFGFVDRTEAYVFFGALACMFGLLSAFITTCFISAIQQSADEVKTIGRIGGFKYFPIFLSIASFCFFGAAGTISAFGLLQAQSTTGIFAIISLSVLVFVAVRYFKWSFKHVQNKVNDKQHGHQRPVISSSNPV
jgi:hypothetical protein